MVVMHGAGVALEGKLVPFQGNTAREGFAAFTRNRFLGAVAEPLDSCQLSSPAKLLGMSRLGLSGPEHRPTTGASSPASIGDCCGSRPGPWSQYPQIFLIRPGSLPCRPRQDRQGRSNLTDPC